MERIYKNIIVLFCVCLFAMILVGSFSAEFREQLAQIPFPTLTTDLANSPPPLADSIDQNPSSTNAEKNETIIEPNDPAPTPTATPDIPTPTLIPQEDFPPTGNVQIVPRSPSNIGWVNEDLVSFVWEVTHSQGLTSLELQLSADFTFSNLLYKEMVGSTQLRKNIIIPENGTFYWRMVGQTTTGSTTSPTALFKKDTKPPVSSITHIYQSCNGTYELEWAGSDEGSGIQTYTVSYKKPTDDAWTILIADTTAQQTVFTPAETNSSYQFRVQAKDNSTLTEPIKPNGDDVVINYCNPETISESSPDGDIWLNNREVRFSWRPINLVNAQAQFLQIASDAGFTTIVAEKEITKGALVATQTFEKDYARLYWRIITDYNDEKRTYTTPAFFRLDTEAPTSEMTKISIVEELTIQLNWSGIDLGSGIAAYNIEFRQQGSPYWSPLAYDYKQTTTDFTVPNVFSVYEFRVLAIDYAGNQERNKQPEAQTIPSVGYRLLLPEVFR